MQTYTVPWEAGAHTAFSGRLCDTLWTSVNYGMYATQFFLGNPKGFNRTKITTNDIDECKKILKKWPMHVFSHYPYIANLAGSKNQLAWSGDNEQDRKLLHVIKELQYELSILGNFDTLRNGVVIHPGNNVDRKNGLKAIAKSINKIEFTNNSKLILENSAGQGTSLATTLEELAFIIKHIDENKKKHIGVCIDTCHLYAVGDYDLSITEEVDRFFSDFEKILGMNCFTLLHLNDSECPKGSCKDRHANLGTGHIWNKSFEPLIHLLNTCKKHGIPMILETHGVDMITLSCLKTD